MSRLNFVLIITLTLTACAPATQAQPTPTATMLATTQTPAPTGTSTPIVVMNGMDIIQKALMAFSQAQGIVFTEDNQPYANEGVVKADDGSYWMYDSGQHTMVNMNLPDGWDVVGFAENEEGNLQVELSDLSQHWFDEEKGEWVGIEKVYNSCLEDELRETIRINVEEQLGMTAGEYFQELKKEYGIVGNFKYTPENKLFGHVFVSGAAEVSLANLPGFSKDDVAMCVYFSTADAPDVMIPVMHSYTLQGKYVQAFLYKDSTGSETNFNNHRSMDETREFFGEMGNNEIGNVAWLYIHRFGQGATDADFDAPDGEKLSFSYGINWLVDALETDYLSRVETAEGHPLAMVEQLDPGLGDVGLIADYTRVIHKRK